MKRKDFIKLGGYACLGWSSIGMMGGCLSAKMVNGILEGEDLVMNIEAFSQTQKGVAKYRNYVIVYNEQLQNPICVFRLNSTQFIPIYMRCPHQGNELSILGDKFHCAAHGSEFDKTGKVTNGPAEENLRVFRVRIENNQLKIALK